MQAPVSVARSRTRSRFLLDGITQGIGQDQPALGVGVQDLDGLAVAHRQDVAELHGPAAGHVLGEGEVASEIHGKPEPWRWPASPPPRPPRRSCRSSCLPSMRLGLRHRPPESNVTPLPTSARWVRRPLDGNRGSRIAEARPSRQPRPSGRRIALARSAFRPRSRRQSRPPRRRAGSVPPA